MNWVNPSIKKVMKKVILKRWLNFKDYCTDKETVSKHLWWNCSPCCADIDVASEGIHNHIFCFVLYLFMLQNKLWYNPWFLFLDLDVTVKTRVVTSQQNLDLDFSMKKKKLEKFEATLKKKDLKDFRKLFEDNIKDVQNTDYQSWLNYKMQVVESTKV